MNKEVLVDVGSQLAHLRMYPVFDVCHYLLTSLQVRDDIQQHQTGKVLKYISCHRFDGLSERHFYSLSILF
jgi:hypothetical protein